MNNIEKVYEMLDWNNDKSVQNKGIKISKEIENLDLFFQPIDLENNIGKNIWENCAKIVCSNSNEKLEKYIYKMLEWLEDLTWPGALLILERLNQIPYKNLKKDLNNAISNAIKDNCIVWLENINELVKDEVLKEKNKKYITNYNIGQVHQELKNIPKSINNILENKLVFESLVHLSQFHDPIFLSYFKKYINSGDGRINFLVTMYSNTINKLMQGENFSNESNKEFYSYLLNIINSNYEINHIENDLNNENLRLNALRMLNLYNSKSLLKYFKKYENDKNIEIKKAVMLCIHNIEYCGY